MPVQHTHVACPVCGATESRFRGLFHDSWQGGPGEFTYVDCGQCGTSYLLDPPADLSPYYPDGYIRTGRLPESVRARMRSHDLAARVRLTRAQHGSTVLDVGCARGDFLQEMRSAGWAVAGVEPTGWLTREALSRGIPVWAGTLAEVSLPRARFDVVTLWDVVEHLGDPRADLTRARSLLRPNGRLILNTPIADGWDARLFGNAWSGWDAPRHRAVYTRRTLARLLQESGFTVLSWHRVFETYLITALTLALAARRRAPRPVADGTWQIVHARPVRLLMEPAFRAADALLGASSMAVVALPCA